MKLATVPAESKKQINRAGRLLADDPQHPDAPAARDLAERWRACHAYPINTFNSTLRKALKSYKEPLAAQRLKRMPTIIDKLKRYPAMQLTTMHDIGGLRAVLNSAKDVRNLADEYKNYKRLAHELVGEYDYIDSPRDEDGYRSLHLVYRYKNSSVPNYNGLRIEIQMRSRLQHTWATAVETMGTLLGQALKSRKGEKDWLDFFAVTSAAFALKEETPPVPRFKQYSAKQTFQAVAKAESKLGALEKMRGLSRAVHHIAASGKASGWSYHLIILNSEEKTVQLKAYDRDSFAKALFDYSALEAEAAKGRRIEPVLVSAGPVDKLKRAYPNFFLDIRDFEKAVSQIIRNA